MRAGRSGAVLAIAVVLASALVSTVSMARTVEHGEIDTWFLFERYTSDTDEFSRCTIESDYESGVGLVFGLRRDFTMEFWISHRNWRYDEGFQRRFVLQMDDLKPVRLDAEAISAKVFYATIPPDQMEFVGNSLANSDVLTVSSGIVEFNFDLYGMGNALEAANDCVVSAMKRENPQRTSTKETDESGIHALLRAAMSRPEMWAYEVFEDGMELTLNIDADLVWMGPGASGVGYAIPKEEFNLEVALLDIAVNYDRVCVEGARFERLEDRPLPNGAYAASLLVECEDGTEGTTTMFTFIPYETHVFRISHIDTGISKVPRLVDDQVLKAIVSEWNTGK